ncbi:MAG: sugar phosphate nucleotidyltransferase [Muribaculaceae bacterium]|nr:sugar phosphate nucleotidyltransferase [Muribaculaceae bacterium]
MDSKKLELHTVSADATLLDALSRLNSLPSGSSMTLVAVDTDHRVCGTLTDGDLRRAMLRGLQLTAPVSQAMHREFGHIVSREECVESVRDMRRRGIRLIPVTDSSLRLVDILDTHLTHNILPLSAILMAGGKGERLRPLTLTTPKPLLPVGGRAIIDYNIMALHSVGVYDISVTVNYMADKLEAHFAGTGVKTVGEPFPMGTLGSAALCDIPAEGDTIVMNADLLTTISLEEFYLHHKNQGADITIAAIPYNVSVPYAILTTNGSEVKGLEEKPSYSYYANAGIYIISNRLLHTLPANERTDATDFIDVALSSGRKVSFFPISGTWIDIGSPTDYNHACELMEHSGLFRR